MFAPGEPAVPLGSAADGTLVNLTSCEGRNHVSFHALTYNLTADWRINDDVLVYLAHRRGYKPGGLNFSVDDPKYQVYGKETLTDVELGLKTSGHLGGLSYLFNGAAFRGDYRKAQIFGVPDLSSDYGLPPGSALVVAITNNGDAVLQGIELESGLKYRDWALNASYSLQHSRFTSGSVPTDGASLRDPSRGFPLTGLAFPGSPKQTASASITYTPSWLGGSLGVPALTVSYSWHGVAPGLAATSVAQVPSYQLVDARLEWSDLLGKPLTLTFWGKNIANADYRTTCVDNSTTIGYVACQFGTQRTYGVAVRYRFGER
jgi:iron complex outermembrane receptor protein